MEVREPEFLKEFWELGVDGAYMYTADKVAARLSTGALPIHGHFGVRMHSCDTQPRLGACRNGDLGGILQRTSKWYAEFIERVQGPNDERFFWSNKRGVAPVPMNTVNIESVKHSIVHSGDWYMANLQPDGRVVYKFWPAENRMSNEYNLVRHTLATWNLVQAYEMDPEVGPSSPDGARRALDYTERYLKTETVPVGRKPWPTTATTTIRNWARWWSIFWAWWPGGSHRRSPVG